MNQRVSYYEVAPEGMKVMMDGYGDIHETIFN